ncbi:MAG: PriCT-2 domain-containing protein [Planctomycetes bacterium]|nr:PriCT-2 domain-containing protein [Planctomycetota bacterium]
MREPETRADDDRSPALATATSLRLVRERAPAELVALPRWIAWNGALDERGRLSKTPLDARTGRGARTNDPSTWATFDAALAYALRTDRVGGLGFVLTDSDYWALDLDHVLDQRSRAVAPPVQRLLSCLPPTYVEVSPSGDGLHVIFAGRRPPELLGTRARDAFGPGRHLEVFGGNSSRYLTVTGRLWSGSAGLAAATPQAIEAVLAMFPAATAPRSAAPRIVRDAGEDERRVERALQILPSDDYDVWIHVGMALRASLPEAAARTLWDAWSSKSTKFDPQASDKHWRSFRDRPGGKTARYIFWLADQADPHWRADWQREQRLATARPRVASPVPSEQPGDSADCAITAEGGLRSGWPAPLPVVDAAPLPPFPIDAAFPSYLARPQRCKTRARGGLTR